MPDTANIMEMTLAELLGRPEIAPIAPYAIKNMDLSRETWWSKTLTQLRQENFGGDLERGFRRLFRAAASGEWIMPLYSPQEEASDPEKATASLVWFPSDDPEADERPFVLVIPGGGFVNVWNLSEGWPVADHFNAAGYHAFIITYRVEGDKARLDKEMDDIAQALRLIKANEQRFHVQGDRYITCGFSAGGYLTCLWSTLGKGYGSHGLPRPQAMIPVYPVVSWKQLQADHDDDPEFVTPLFYTDIAQAVTEDYEIPEHVEGFPPCAIFLAAQDELVPPVHSRLLQAALEAKGIPCRMEIGPVGGHGFADGTGTCMAGWPERAIRWIENL